MRILKEEHLKRSLEPFRGLMPNELAIVDFSKETSVLRHAYTLITVETLAKHTRKAALYVNMSALKMTLDEQSDWLHRLVKMGLRRLYISMHLNVPTFNYSGVDYNSPYILDALEQFDRFRREHSNLQIVPCLSCPPDQIHHLGPLISFFNEKGYKEVLLVPPGKRTESAVMAYRDLFEYLRMRSVNQMWIPFDYTTLTANIWNIQTFNGFAGPETVHFDISNKCTHSCIFCGLYADDAIAIYKKADAPTQKHIQSMMKATLDPEKGRQILETLPESVQSLQFGGMGDPMTHPNFVEFIRVARERGIRCEVLSNMDYFTEESIMELSELGSSNKFGLHFIANISGASPEMYLKTRPRQTMKNYDRVMKTLHRLKEEREQNGRGVFVTMMCVMNNINYVEAPEYVDLAEKVGASRVFLKPLEVHMAEHRRLLPDDSIKTDYTRKIAEAVKIADRLGLEIMDRETIEKILEMKG